MKTHNENYFIQLLTKEIVPALGCTEPIAVALAASKSSETLGGLIDNIEVYVSNNILKNGMGVGIPGTGMVGLNIAAALGCIGGNSKAGLEVLKNINKEDIYKSKQLLKENKVTVLPKKVPNKLYVEVTCNGINGKCTTIIKDNHSNIVSVKLNNKLIVNNEIEDSKKEEQCCCTEEIQHTNIDEIYDFIMNVDHNKISFLLDGAEMNKKIGVEGITNDYGLKVGKTIYSKMKSGLIGDDIQNYAMALTAGASDARMAGCMLPVMSNSGSGNQGLTVMLPVVAVCEKLKVSKETQIRALALANLIAIHIKSYLGRLSALCGCVVSASGASAGIVYLLGGDLKKIKYAIKNMAGNIVGMICDGAKTGCALKVSTGVSAAMQSALLAMDNIEISCQDGIINDNIEETIKNLAKIGSEGMKETDNLILDIMTSKKC
ncbi:hypothetical protein C3495_03935 [Clostridiaceae bacterium 14S0207]|nr:hypothetical protein C3495_03935 [Clostridiaceae bacterium 14S0207]